MAHEQPEPLSQKVALCDVGDEPGAAPPDRGSRRAERFPSVALLTGCQFGVRQLRRARRSAKLATAGSFACRSVSGAPRPAAERAGAPRPASQLRNLRRTRFTASCGLVRAGTGSQHVGRGPGPASIRSPCLLSPGGAGCSRAPARLGRFSGAEQTAGKAGIRRSLTRRPDISRSRSLIENIAV